MSGLLENKNAIIYGAAEIDADGGTAHVAVVAALDDAAVNGHVQAVVDQGGTVDVCFT
jgi:hypothetical protein